MMRRFLAMCLAGVLSACSGLPFNAQAPRVSVADVEIRSLGLLEQKLDLGLRVANPNDFDLRIEALDFELEVNGRPFATGLSRVSTLVPAASMSVLRVDAIIQSKNLIRQIRTPARRRAEGRRALPHQGARESGSRIGLAAVRPRRHVRRRVEACERSRGLVVCFRNHARRNCTGR